MNDFEDMYRDYVALEGLTLVKREYGYYTYKVEHNHLYIETIYIAPEVRRSGNGLKLLKMAEELAAAKGLEGILGSCSPGRKGSTESLKAMLGCGFELRAADKDIIYLIKPLKAEG